MTVIKMDDPQYANTGRIGLLLFRRLDDEPLGCGGGATGSKLLFWSILSISIV